MKKHETHENKRKNQKIEYMKKTEMKKWEN